jgi:hypothetical protein
MMNGVSIHANPCKKFKLLNFSVFRPQSRKCVRNNSADFGFFVAVGQVKLVDFSCNGVNFLFRKCKDNSRQEIFFFTMVDKLFEDSVLFASIGIFHIAFGNFFDELIDS